MLEVFKYLLTSLILKFPPVVARVSQSVTMLWGLCRSLRGCWQISSLTSRGHAWRGVESPDGRDSNHNVYLFFFILVHKLLYLNTYLHNCIIWVIQSHTLTRLLLLHPKLCVFVFHNLTAGAPLPLPVSLSCACGIVKCCQQQNHLTSIYYLTSVTRWIY